MKKILLTVIAVLTISVAASAQSRALGVRLGGNAEVSYQHYMIGDSFLEADLGLAFLNDSGFYASGIYNFVIGNLNSINIYAGPGVCIGAHNTVNENDKITTNFALGIAGQLGAEWQMGVIPFNLSLDWRPYFDFIGHGLGWTSLALGLRYRF